MRNLEYWKSRTEQNMLNAELRVLEFERDLGVVWNGAIEKIQSEVDSLFSKYADKNVISFTEAQRILDQKELAGYKKELNRVRAEAIRNGMPKEYVNQLDRMLKTQRVSRLTAIQNNISVQANTAKFEQFKASTQLLKQEYSNAYYRTIFDVAKYRGVGASFELLNMKAIEAAVKQKWDGANYSNRIWTDKNRLVQNLERLMARGIAIGNSSTTIATELSEQMGTSFYNAQRLARTEMNNIFNQGTADGYKEADVDEYEYLATLDDRTSEICQELDGKRFKLNEKEIGVNYPPMHPNCRSTTVAIIEDKQYEERLAKGESGYYKVPGNMNYAEWFDQYVAPNVDDDSIVNRNVTNTQVNEKRDRMRQLREQMAE